MDKLFYSNKYLLNNKKAWDSEMKIKYHNFIIIYEINDFFTNSRMKVADRVRVKVRTIVVNKKCNSYLSSY